MIQGIPVAIVFCHFIGQLLRTKVHITFFRFNFLLRIAESLAHKKGEIVELVTQSEQAQQDPFEDAQDDFHGRVLWWVKLMKKGCTSVAIDTKRPEVKVVNPGNVVIFADYISSDYTEDYRTPEIITVHFPRRPFGPAAPSASGSRA